MKYRQKDTKFTTLVSVPTVQRARVDFITQKKSNSPSYLKGLKMKTVLGEFYDEICGAGFNSRLANFH